MATVQFLAISQEAEIPYQLGNSSSESEQETSYVAVTTLPVGFASMFHQPMNTNLMLGRQRGVAANRELSDPDDAPP
jgi:hypothetical protein